MKASKMKKISSFETLTRICYDSVFLRFINYVNCKCYHGDFFFKELILISFQNTVYTMLALFHGNKLQHFIEAFNKISFLIKRYVIIPHNFKNIFNRFNFMSIKI